MADNKSRPWKEFLHKLRNRRDEVEEADAKFLRDLDYALNDDFRWFGRTLYPGWSR